MVRAESGQEMSGYLLMSETAFRSYFRIIGKTEEEIDQMLEEIRSKPIYNEEDYQWIHGIKTETSQK